MEGQEQAALQRWWFSWVADESRPAVWPMPSGWLGFWCTGYTSDDRATLCGWAEAEDEVALQAMVLQGWPEWNGYFRSEPRSVDESWHPGDRFPVPAWSSRRHHVAAALDRVAAALGVEPGPVGWANTGQRIRFHSADDAWWTFDMVSMCANVVKPIAGGEASFRCSFELNAEPGSATSLERAVQRLKAGLSAALAVNVEGP